MTAITRNDQTNQIYFGMDGAENYAKKEHRFDIFKSPLVWTVKHAHFLIHERAHPSWMDRLTQSVDFSLLNESVSPLDTNAAYLDAP